MTTVTSFCFITFFLAYLNNCLVSGLLCAQCTPADPACRSGNIMPTLCGGGEAYCYVIHVYVERAQGTYRGCIGTDTFEGCRPVTVRQRQGTSCMTVCDWDGCNSSQGAVVSSLNSVR